MPSSDFPPTNAAASLYVGDLHHDVTEDMLFEKFSPVGVVCSIRVCRDRITGRSLGYAYVNFQVQADAERALDTMNFDVIHGRPVRIMWTQHDPTLRDSGVGNIFIKNLEKSIDSEDLYHTFSVFGNILSCKVACDENGSKGYGFVHFETQEAAERAIKRLNGMLFNDQKVFIGCFKTRREREAELGAQVPYAIKGSRDEYVDEEKPMEVSSKHDNTSEHGQQTSKTASSDVTNPAASLYVGDLHYNVTEDMLHEKFGPVGAIRSIRVCRDRITGRSLGYAYVNFQQQADAERALETMNFDVIHGRPVRIMWTQHDPTLRDSGVGNIFIKNLEKSIDSEDLYHTFSVFGNILSCKVACDENGSKGYGFVHFETREAAEQAIKRLNGMLFNDQKVFIGHFKTRRERSAELGAQVPNVIKGSGEDLDDEEPRDITGKHDSTNTTDNGEPALKMASSDVINPMASLCIGDLHHDVTGNMLYEKFSPVGAISSIQVCRDRITGRSLGYAYVNFQQQADAERAMDTMNFDVIKGRPVRIMWTQHDPSLRESSVGNIIIKNLEKSIKSEALYNIFSVFGNILSCKVACDENGSKGYGFVHFETQEAAERAIERLNGMLFNNQKVFIGRFKTRKERNPESGPQFTNVFIKGLGEEMDDEKLREVFSKYGNTISTRVITDNSGKFRGFGFVRFERHEDAQKAVDELNGKLLNGKQICVGRAMKKTKQQTQVKPKFVPHYRYQPAPPSGSFMAMPPQAHHPATGQWAQLRPGLRGGAPQGVRPQAQTRSPWPATVDAAAAARVQGVPQDQYPAGVKNSQQHMSAGKVEKLP